MRDTVLGVSTQKRRLSISIALLSAAGALLVGLPSQPCQAGRSSPAKAPRSTPKGIETVVTANNRFAFDLYAKLSASSEDNVFFAPFSVSSALAMTYEGANGKTAAEMRRALYLPSKSVLKPNIAAIDNRLNTSTKPRSLWTGNALWVQKSFPLLPSYTKRIAKYYGEKATNLDFVSQPQQSRQAINAYIAKQTRNKIPDLIPQGAINADIRIVLTNAVYFKSDWKWQFDKNKTYEGDFTVAPGNLVKTQLMHMIPNEQGLQYVDTGKLQILSLPYKGDKFSMLILLPTGNLDSLGRLTAGGLNALKAKMKPRVLDSITIPKFEFDAAYSLESALQELGMPRLFSPSLADLSGMDGKKDLSISFVFHKAYVKVDEQGTEATGATAVGGGLTALRPRNDFTANHPFVFLIQDNQTGNILFLGRVVDPTK